jgi:hypothetical protein
VKPGQLPRSRICPAIASGASGNVSVQEKVIGLIRVAFRLQPVEP